MQIENPQSTTLAEGLQQIVNSMSANLRVCDLRNLFTDHTPLEFGP
jgi:hypothetical protein